ncbi:MAG: hypothetical protein RBU23_12810 [Candidatus Auribacterota bacterium]|jgi:hypothetical protein|nr:hypothetical protein [Candidatus Auribacterota bacterium]
MQFQPYNKKGFLLPDSIRSMAAYHAKLFENGEYMFRIHDCITGIRLRGVLETEEDYDEAIGKIETLMLACCDFARHLRNIKESAFDPNAAGSGNQDATGYAEKEPEPAVCESR